MWFLSGCREPGRVTIANQSRKSTTGSRAQWRRRNVRFWASAYCGLPVRGKARDNSLLTYFKLRFVDDLISNDVGHL